MAAWLVAVLALPIGEAIATETKPDPAPTIGDGSRVKSSTGFFVSQDGIVLTTAHGIAGCKTISIWPNGATARAGRLIAADRRLDVALLSTFGPAPRYAAAVEREYPRVGEPIAAVGLGVHVSEPLLPVIIEGSLAGNGWTPAGYPVLLIHAHVPEGASGGPVVDADGSLIGMIIGYYVDRPNVGVVRALGDVANFLARNRVMLTHGSPLAAGSTPLNDQLVEMSVLVQCAAARK